MWRCGTHGSIYFCGCCLRILLVDKSKVSGVSIFNISGNAVTFTGSQSGTIGVPILQFNLNVVTPSLVVYLDDNMLDVSGVQLAGTVVGPATLYRGMPSLAQIDGTIGNFLSDVACTVGGTPSVPSSPPRGPNPSLLTALVRCHRIMISATSVFIIDSNTLLVDVTYRGLSNDSGGTFTAATPLMDIDTFVAGPAGISTAVSSTSSISSNVLVANTTGFEKYVTCSVVSHPAPPAPSFLYYLHKASHVPS